MSANLPVTPHRAPASPTTTWVVPNPPLQPIQALDPDLGQNCREEDWAEYQELLQYINRYSIDTGPAVGSTPNPNNLAPTGIRIHGDMITRPWALRNGAFADSFMAFLIIVADFVNTYHRRGGTKSAQTRNVPVIAVRPANFGSAVLSGNPENPRYQRGGVGYILRRGNMKESLDCLTVSKILTADGMGHTDGNSESPFFQVQQILVPIESHVYAWATTQDKQIGAPKQTYWHATLLVISPKAKTIDHLDGLFSITPLDNIISNVYNLLAVHLGRDFIPSQWRWRQNGSIAQRRADTDCVFIGCFNALCVACSSSPESLGARAKRDPAPAPLPATQRLAVPMTEARRQPIQRWRRTLAFHMFHTRLDQDIASWHNYLIHTTVPLPTTFNTITGEMLADLPLAVRARTGDRDMLQSKEAVQQFINLEENRLAFNAIRPLLNSNATLAEWIQVLEITDWNRKNSLPLTKGQLEARYDPFGQKQWARIREEKEREYEETRISRTDGFLKMWQTPTKAVIDLSISSSNEQEVTPVRSSVKRLQNQQPARNNNGSPIKKSRKGLEKSSFLNKAV